MNRSKEQGASSKGLVFASEIVSLSLLLQMEVIHG